LEISQRREKEFPMKRIKEGAMIAFAGGIGLLNLYLMLEGYAWVVACIDFSFDLTIKLSTRWAGRI
jgi:hypothetical protein